MSTDETMQTSPTGGTKAGNLERYSLIPVEPLRLLAKHYGIGAKKYSDDNWRKGYDWKWSIDSLHHHLASFCAGEDIDAETGTPHIIAVAWHAFTLQEFSETHPEFDTRLKTLDQRGMQTPDIRSDIDNAVRQKIRDEYRTGGPPSAMSNLVDGLLREAMGRPLDTAPLKAAHWSDPHLTAAHALWEFSHGEGHGSFTGQKPVEPKWCDDCTVWYHPTESRGACAGKHAETEQDDDDWDIDDES